MYHKAAGVNQIFLLQSQADLHYDIFAIASLQNRYWTDMRQAYMQV
jgi:hypothetical protein